MAVTSIDQLLCYTREHDVGLVPLVSPTTQIGAGSLSGSADPSIGFTFVFDGVPYTSYHVRPYGFVRLAGTLTSAVNSALFSSSTNVLLAPWYDSMRTAYTTGYVKTEVQGVEPFRRHVVEWHCYLVSGHTATDHDLVTVQCVLYETTNVIEYRYGPRVRAGSPVGTVSASIGFKGDTSVIATNRRDLLVFDLPLGGSATTTTTNVGLAQYDALAERYVYVIEPAYPMTGRFLPVGFEQLVGQLGPEAEPIRTYAHNCNWHYCRHTPPAANFITELQDGVLQSGTTVTVVPITPSLDGLDYLCSFVTYNAASADLTLKVWTSDLAAPRWDIDGDWTTRATDGLPAVSGWQEWDDLPAAIPDRERWLRVTLEISSAAGALTAGIMHPEPLDEPPTSTTPIGWTRMGLGILLAQRGQPVGPEYLNRMWNNIAKVQRDRKQAAFSMVRPIGSPYEVASIATRPSRTMTFFPVSMLGQSGAQVNVRGYARSFGGTGKIHVRSSGGDTLTLTITDTGVFQALTGWLEVRGEHPIVSVTYEPPASGTLQVGSLVGLWGPGD